ncbi:MAG: hypothetical protein ACTHJ1_10535 [Bordetella sp.]|uniref:hypothetical protein n=1 Tax=Bordetella sp. TaxID=28081 RepID=UPI003F7B6347
MHSSISNFDKFRWKRLRDVALAMIVLVALYGTLVQIWSPFIEVGQNQEATNRIRLENYLDSASNPPIVLVGSSLSTRLAASALGPLVENLGISGGSSLTGLDVLAHAHKHPRIVVIEANLLDRPIDVDLIETLFREPISSLRSKIKVLQYRYRPVNLIYGLIAARHVESAEADVPPAIFNLLLQDQIKSQSRLLNPAIVKNHIVEMTDLVSRLVARGINPVFLTIPVDPALTQSPQANQFRHIFESAFPKSKYCWIRPTLPGVPRTRDGLHLVQADAAIVASQIEPLAHACYASTRNAATNITR